VRLVNIREKEAQHVGEIRPEKKYFLKWAYFVGSYFFRAYFTGYRETHCFEQHGRAKLDDTYQKAASSLLT
jgi:hypothetical protein